MLGDAGADIAKGFRLSGPCAADGNPRACIAGWPEWTSGQQMAERMGIDSDVDDPLCSDDLEAESRFRASCISNGVEVKRNSGTHFEAGVKPVSRQTADPFFPLSDIVLRGKAFSLIQVRGTAEGIASKEAGEIKDV